MNSQFFVGGMPTDLDVKKIRDAYPEDKLSHGTIIPYSDVEILINTKKDSNRFKGVTSRWRGIILKESNIIIGTERGIGFKILNDSEKVDLSGSKIRAAASSMRKSQIFASKVDVKNISKEEKERLNLFCLRSAKAYSMLQLQSNLSLPTMEQK